MVMPAFAPTNPWHEPTLTLTALLDSSLKAAREAEPRREYLGASMMARECLRSVAYEYHNTPKDQGAEFGGRLYRVFDMGHDGEARMANYMRLAGFSLQTEDDTGEQFAYSAADGQMQGHCDGIIVAGPPVPGCEWPALWENKAVNAETFAAFQRRGIRIERPLYYGQVQVYMAYFGLERCLFTVICRDSGNLHVEVIPFNPEHAQAVSDSGVRVIVSRSADDFPRIGRDETDFRCRFCAWRRRCWTPEIDRRINTPAPGWLRGGA